MKKFQAFGAATKEESQREKNHQALARRAAAEGFVLLKTIDVTARSSAMKQSH